MVQMLWENVIKLLLYVHFTQAIQNIFDYAKFIRKNLPLSQMYYVLQNTLWFIAV